MDVHARSMVVFLVLAWAFSLSCTNGYCQKASAPDEQAAPLPAADEPKLKLIKAVMGEKVENLVPVKSAIAFSVGIGQVYCYTSFDPVPQPTVIYHRWFHREDLSTQTRLRLYPPKWATYSVIQLRETDKGPWRVEITDHNGRILDVLRFSITD
jgi:hypothetical protein